MSVLAAPLSVTACDIFAPQERAVTVNLCQLGYPPQWIAVQPAGSAWEFLPVSGTTIAFDAPEKLGLAFGTGSSSYVYYLTRTELREVSCRYFGELATVSVTASVRGMGAGQRFRLQGTGLALVSGTRDSTFLLRLPPSAGDVHAWLFSDSLGSFGRPLRALARHSLQPVDGMTLPAFDFSSADALPFDSAPITVRNVSGLAVWSYNQFRAPGITMGIAVDDQPPEWHFAVPEALLGPHDYHVYQVDADNRSVAYLYRRARNTTVSLGAELMTPSANVVEGRPCLRLRAWLPSQSDYPSFVTVHFNADYGFRDRRSVSVTVSRNYLGGTPGTWDVAMPEMRPPVDDTCLLSPDPAAGWSVSAEGNEGRVALALGGKGLDGELRRIARSFASP